MPKKPSRTPRPDKISMSDPQTPRWMRDNFFEDLSKMAPDNPKRAELQQHIKHLTRTADQYDRLRAPDDSD